MRKTCTSEEEKYIRENYTTKTDGEIAAAIGRSEPWVQKYRFSNGLNKARKSSWNSDTDSIILDRRFTISELMAKFPERSKESIENRQRYLHTVIGMPYTYAEPKPFPSDYKPSYLREDISIELILAVRIQKMLKGTYATRGIIA
jgi:hypothetical protein